MESDGSVRVGSSTNPWRDDKPLTTGDVARHCHVSPVTVWRWIKQGKLVAHRHAGGRYQIEKAALRTFLQERNMPLDPEFFAKPSWRILIIDDEPTVLEVATRALQQLACVTIATAKDGFEAGLQVATFKPDLMILDLMMPNLDGFQVCRIVRRNPTTSHIKILIITAFGTHENLQRVFSNGADGFLHKPLDIKVLQDKVRGLLEDWLPCA